MVHDIYVTFTLSSWQLQISKKLNSCWQIILNGISMYSQHHYRIVKYLESIINAKLILDLELEHTHLAYALSQSQSL